jgi:hypothetical protein
MSAEEQKQIDDERAELLGLLRGARAMANAIFTVCCFSGAGILVLGSIAISDHVNLRRLREEMDYVKPKVDRLWFKTYPDAPTGFLISVPENPA